MFIVDTTTTTMSINTTVTVKQSKGKLKGEDLRKKVAERENVEQETGARGKQRQRQK